MKTKGILLCDENFVQNHLELRAASLPEDQIQALTAFDPNGDREPIYHVEGDTGIIEIYGSLSANGPDFWDLFFGEGGTAYPDIIAAIKEAEADPTVKRIKAVINSPGGEAIGADVVRKAFRDAKKPTKAINAGLMASAAYFIACGWDKIEAREPMALTGSVGVITAGLDTTERDKQEGIKRIKIRSSNAPKKYPEIGTKVGKDTIQERLDAMENILINGIAEGRKTSAQDVRDNFGQGQMFVAENPDGSDAIKKKMIDGMEKMPKNEKKSPFPLPNSYNASSENSKESKKMTLDEFLAQDASAKAQYDQAIRASNEAGAKESTEKAEAVAKAKVDATSKYLSGDYPQAVKAKATECLEGKISVEAFVAAATAYEMLYAEEKTIVAEGETKDNGETRPDNGKAPDGKLESQEDIDAAIQEELEGGEHDNKE